MYTARRIKCVRDWFLHEFCILGTWTCATTIWFRWSALVITDTEPALTLLGETTSENSPSRRSFINFLFTKGTAAFNSLRASGKTTACERAQKDHNTGSILRMEFSKKKKEKWDNREESSFIYQYLLRIRHTITATILSTPSSKERKKRTAEKNNPSNGSAYCPRTFPMHYFVVAVY